MALKPEEIRVELGQLNEDTLLDFADFLARVIAEDLLSEAKGEKHEVR